MHRPLLATLLLLGAPAGLIAQQGSDAPSVTLFNSGRVLVRRTFAVPVPSGASTMTLPIGLFEPASLMSLEPGVRLGRFSFDGASTEEALLRRHIGEKFMIDVSNGTTRALASYTLLALQPERWQSGDAVVFGRPGQIRWDLARVPTTPVTDVFVTSDRARSGLKVMYATSGASWGVSYSLILGNAGRIEGLASIMTGTLDLANAEVQLLAGDIGTPPQGPQPRAYAMAAKAAEGGAFADGVPSNEAVGEARLYTLPGRVTFMPSTQLVTPLFDPTPARAERRYTVSGGMPFWGSFEQQADEQEVPVAVAYRLERKLGTTFGDLALPAGGVQVFETDKAGRLQLIGMGSIGHTAAGEELMVSTGTAFDVTAKRTQTAYTTQRGTAPNTNRTIAFASFRVDLQNAKDSAVVVEVREDRGGEWSVVESSVAGQRRSASRMVFPVTVPAKGKATLTYRIRTVW
ncbi:MAG: hypothetical protein SFU84_14315 [Gemmatimonadales bacterium]|nr:hypothetical protein [Gemmatimonadales bacterium]